MKSIIRLNRRRGAALLGVGGIVAAAVGVLPANAAVNFADAAFSGSASADAIHVDAAANSVAVDVGHGSTAVNSKGITPAATDAAINLPINPALPTKDAYAFGKGLEAATISIADKAESSAPPNAAPVLNEAAVPVSSLAYASLSRGYAATKYNTDTCVLGSDLAKGYGYAADAQLIGAANNPDGTITAPLVSTDTDPNTRDVVQGLGRETLVPNSQGNFGLQSQVTNTLAPVTLFKGTANQTTIVVLGDWVLTAIASGIPGESKVTYTSPGGTTSPQTPVLRVLDKDGLPLGELLFQDLLGTSGLTIPIPGIADIQLAVPPTQTISADGTTVSATADVVKIVLADAQLSNIRIGHAAVKAMVPAGGITCPIPVSKTATPNNVNATSAPDGKFVVAITVRNPFDCELINLSAIDLITRKSGNLKFNIEENDPRNDPGKGAGAVFTTNSPTSATATYANLGTLAPGATKVINVVLKVASGSGEIQDIATAKGTLNCGAGSAIGKATANLTGSFTLVTVAGAILARTGGTATVALILAGSAMAAVATRRYVRTRRVRA